MAGPWCYLWAKLKHRAGYDDSLDAYGVHGTGGILGGILTGFFATPNAYEGFGSPAYSLNITYHPGVFYAIGSRSQGTQLGVQIYGCVVTMFYSAFASFVLLQLVDRTIGLKELVEEDASVDNDSIPNNS